MHIGVDIRCLMNPVRTGVGEYTYQLLNAVFKMDKENQYFLFYNSSKDVSQFIPKWEQINVHYVGLWWPNKLLNLLLWLGLVNLDKLIAGNLDYFFSPNLNFISLSRKTKFILTIHDLSFEFLPECFTLKQRLWHWFLRPKKQCERADVVLVPSENTRRDVIESCKVVSSKVVKVGHGCQYPISNIQYPISNNKYILYMGTLEPRKNVEVLIDAYRKLYNSTTFTTYNMVIAGDKGWKSDKLVALINNTPGVEYVGYVDETKKTELYQNAALFVFPSLYEGFGLPVLEAMAFGVPVIASNRPSLGEVCGNAAYYVNPNNVADLAGVMKLVLADDKLRQEMSWKGIVQAQKFNWEDSARLLLSLF